MENPGTRVLPKLGIGQRVLRSCKRVLPLSVWMGALGALFLLAQSHERGFRLTGFARATRSTVGPEIAGRLAVLAVAQDEEVVAGQLLASLDSAAVDLSLASAQAELSRLEAELAKETLALDQLRDQQQSDYRAQLRRFVTDREEAHIDVLKMDAAIQRDEVRLQAVDTELRRLESIEPGIVSAAKIEDTQIERRELETRIRANREVLAGLRELHQQARVRVEEFVAAHTDGGDPDALLRPLEWAIAAQRVRLEEIQLRRTQLAVRAPFDGRVAEVLRRAGEVVAAGEPVLAVVEREPREVLVHVPEDRLFTIAAGVEASLRREADPRMALDAVVLRTGSQIEQIPVRADPTTQAPRWGVPVYLQCPPGEGVLPGERFIVTFRPPEDTAVPDLAAPR